MRFQANGIVLKNEMNGNITSKAAELVFGRSIILSKKAAYIEEK